MADNKLFVTTHIFLMIISFLFIFSCRSVAQNRYSIFLQSTADFCSMSDLKKIQENLAAEIRTTLTIPAKITESFPVRLSYSAGIIIPLNISSTKQYSLGLYGKYSSTGGRINYQDYSGEICVDQIVNGYSFGTFIGYSAIEKNSFSFDYNLAVRVIRTDFLLKNYLNVGSSKSTSNIEFYSYSIGIEPALIPSYTLKSIKIGLSCSYLINVPTELKLSSNSEMFLTDNKGKAIKAQWSGAQIGLLLSYLF